MNTTRHAETRMQQRAISPVVFELLQIYGDEQLQKGGSRVLRLNRRQRKRAEKELSRLLDYVRRENSPYFILGDQGQVITAGHQYQSIRCARQTGY